MRYCPDRPACGFCYDRRPNVKNPPGSGISNVARLRAHSIHRGGARAAVMPLERAGGQAQFIVHEPPVADRTSIGQLLSWDSTESLRRSLPSCYRSARGHEHSNVNATFSRASRDDPSQLDFWGPCPPCSSASGNDPISSRASGGRIRFWISSRDAAALCRYCRHKPSVLPTRILVRRETNSAAPVAPQKKLAHFSRRLSRFARHIATELQALISSFAIFPS